MLDYPGKVLVELRLDNTVGRALASQQVGNPCPLVIEEASPSLEAAASITGTVFH
jgi:hypothetical protein